MGCDKRYIPGPSTKNKEVSTPGQRAGSPDEKSLHEQRRDTSTHIHDNQDKQLTSHSLLSTLQLDFLMPASFPEYTRQPGLENHPGTILALALTTDGKTLVTGGQDLFATEQN
jgi:hypothetical protein